MATEPQPLPKPATESPRASQAPDSPVAANHLSARSPGQRSSLRAALRGLLLMIFAGVLLVFGLDRWARHEVQTAFEAVDEALESRHEPGKFTAADVHALIGRQPDQPAEAPDHIERYHWRGALHSFTLFVAYDRDGVLRQVSIDAPPPATRSSAASEPMGAEDSE